MQILISEKEKKYMFMENPRNYDPELKFTKNGTLPYLKGKNTGNQDPCRKIK